MEDHNCTIEERRAFDLLKSRFASIKWKINLKIDLELTAEGALLLFLLLYPTTMIKIVHLHWTNFVIDILQFPTELLYQC